MGGRDETQLDPTTTPPNNANERRATRLRVFTRRTALSTHAAMNPIYLPCICNSPFHPDASTHAAVKHRLNSDLEGTGLVAKSLYCSVYRQGQGSIPTYCVWSAMLASEGAKPEAINDVVKRTKGRGLVMQMGTITILRVKCQATSPLAAPSQGLYFH
ncbi:uncharacterized protein LOC117643453 isoform X1 [Thrips palmi]|uniref:Uncharacterized protein LOC117643453 isoform X1 n=1 Tax=Thrips palmi TaxID=161013 RepID=A0A6P8ZL54_THRPL|nr:uncharacterized protein LOC117643453 isoform X1 [Thrips palmi]